MVLQGCRCGPAAAAATGRQSPNMQQLAPVVGRSQAVARMAVCGSIAPTATLAARPRAFRAAHPLRPSTRQRRLCSGAAAPLLHAWPAAESVAGAVAHALASTAATLSAVWAAVLRYVADVLVRRNLVAQQPAEELLVVNSSPGSPQTPEEYVNRWRTLVEKERSEAERLFKERVRRVPLKTLVKRGQALVGLVLRDSYTDPSSGRTVLRLAAANGQRLPDHQFGPGEPVEWRPWPEGADDSGATYTRARGTDDPYLECSEAVAAGVAAAAAAAGGAWGVNISSSSASEDERNASFGRWRAEVLDTNATGLRLMLPEDAECALGVGEGIRLDLSYNDVTFQRMAAALDAVEQQGGQQQKHSTWSLSDDADGVPPGPRCPLLDVLLASQPGPLAQQPAGPLLLLGALGSLHAALASSSLNTAQREAVAAGLSRRLTLVHGPPGTGKTATAVRLVTTLVCLAKPEAFLSALGGGFLGGSTGGSGGGGGDGGGRSDGVLVVAQSNVAVDSLAEGLYRSLGRGVVRVGSPTRVREALADCTLDAHMARHPRAYELRDLRRQLAEAREALAAARRNADAAAAATGVFTGGLGLRPPRRGSGYGKGGRGIRALKRRADDLRARVEALQSAMQTSIILGAQAVCATCAGAGGPELRPHAFRCVVLDEGSQCSEPEALVALAKGAEQAVLVGDPLQLPPVVQSRSAAAEGLAVSLFERLLSLGVPSHLLDTQYRMHPAIAAFPCAAFYGGRLKDGVGAGERPAPPLPFLQPTQPVAFLHMDSPDAVQRDTGSKYNVRQAEAVAKLVKLLVTRGGVAPEDIGVVTPYTAQVEEIVRQLTRAGVDVARGAQRGRQGDGAAEGKVEVRTVDGYQGREKEVVVFSTVRSNKRGQVGFLRDPRRLNVALTRPRRALLLLGNVATLVHDATLESYLRWLDDRGCIRLWNEVDLRP